MHVQILIAWKCTFRNQGFNSTALPQGTMFAVKPSGAKQELWWTTQFINTIMLDVWGQSWNTEEEVTYSMPRTGPTPGSALFCLCCCCVYVCVCHLDQTWVRSWMSSVLQLSAWTDQMQNDNFFGKIMWDVMGVWCCVSLWANYDTQ